jgi:adenylate cyclase
LDLVNQPSLVLNGVEFDFDAGLLRGKDGEDIPLRPQSLAVLKHLVDNANHVVTKEELLDTIWPGIAVTDNSLTQCVSEIRKAVGDEEQILLKTVARRGYRLVLKTEALGLSPDDSSQDYHHAKPSKEDKGHGRVGLIFAIAALVIAAAVVVFIWIAKRNVEAPASLSIAVLPFANRSEAEAQAYLANGFTDDLTAELARVPGLFVISRNAARAYRDGALSPAQIAKGLGVRYLLEGSVRRLGDEVRITAHLVDASTAGQIWAERFEGEFADVFKLQDQVIGQIVGALELKLVPGKANLAVSGDTENPDAYEAFRRGVEARRADTLSGTVEALGFLRQALALDPNFGAAAAEMAWLYWDADDMRRQVLGLSWKEIDDGLHGSLPTAARNPSPGYYQLISELLVREHRSDDAVAALQKAIALDPSDPWTYEGLSQALNFNGRPAEGRTFLDTALRVDPGWTEWRRYQAGLAAFGQGRYKEAVAQLEQVDVRSPNPWTKFYSLHVLVAALAHLDRLPEAETALKKLRMVLSDRQEGRPNLLIAQQFFVYKQPEDIARLLDGLTKAGVPELPAGTEPESAERMNSVEIGNLFFGHELTGRQILPEVSAYHALIAADGTVTRTIGEVVVTGRMWVQGDSLCSAYPRQLTGCGAVFRNPSSRSDATNEYILLSPFKHYEFSVTK